MNLLTEHTTFGVASYQQTCCSELFPSWCTDFHRHRNTKNLSSKLGKFLKWFLSCIGYQYKKRSLIQCTAYPQTESIYTTVKGFNVVLYLHSPTAKTHASYAQHTKLPNSHCYWLGWHWYIPFLTCTYMYQVTASGCVVLEGYDSGSTALDSKMKILNTKLDLSSTNFKLWSQIKWNSLMIIF